MMQSRTTQSYNKRRKTERRGRWAEKIAAVLLIIKGYKILKTRYKSPVGEIDLIAQKGSEICCVEVKLRPTLAQGMEAITPHQKRRIIRAAMYFNAGNQAQKIAQYSTRFDVIIIAPWHWPLHMKNAFS